MINFKSIRDHVFVEKEFDDPNYPNSGRYLDGTLMVLLLRLRQETGWPMIPHGSVGGAVDMNGTGGHATKSFHLFEMGCKAVDFHFITNANTREQYYEVSKIGFGGVGIYYDWHWAGKKLPIGFHVDVRDKSIVQRWRRENGQYIYLL